MTLKNMMVQIYLKKKASIIRYEINKDKDYVYVKMFGMNRK